MFTASASLKMCFRTWKSAIRVRTMIIMSLLYRLNVIECSVPCELIYGGCKHSGDSFYPPVLTLKHHPEPLKYNQQVYVPSPPGKPPRCAKPGLTFCERIDKYPTDLIKTLAAKTNYNFRSLFADETSGARRSSNGGSLSTSNSDVFDSVTILNGAFNQSSQHGIYPERLYPLDESSIRLVDPVVYAAFEYSPPNDWWKRSDRVSSRPSHKRKRRQAKTELCPTRSQFIMPRAALNNKGEWKYVVNVEQGSEKYTQLVRSETCLTKECDGICSLPNGYTSRCEQKYVQKRLVALEGSGNNLYTDIFWFPHCCICQIAPDIR